MWLFDYELSLRRERVFAIMQISSLSQTLAAGVWVLATGSGGIVWSQSTANWLFPLEDGLTINTIDKIFQQWESNYAEAWLNMWCQNGTAGNNVVLGELGKCMV